MNEVRHYRDLKVWQKAMDMAELIYKMTDEFPHHQKYILVSQMQRSALSVPSNIAEGRARHFEKDFIYHLNVAKGSLAELETQILLSQRLHYLEDAVAHKLLLQTEEITKMLHGLKSSLRPPAHVMDLTLAKT